MSTINQTDAHEAIRNLTDWLDTLKGWDIATHQEYMRLRDITIAAIAKPVPPVANTAVTYHLALRGLYLTPTQLAESWCPFDTADNAHAIRRQYDSPENVVVLRMDAGDTITDVTDAGDPGGG